MKTVIAICFSIIGLWSQDSTLVKVRNAPGSAQYPQAGAIILFEKITERYDMRSPEREVYRLIKLLNDRGIDEFGDQKVSYDRNSEEVKIIEARTIKPDLTILKPLKTAISDVSAVEVAEAPAYANAMLKVVSFSGLEKDAVIEFHYKVISKTKRALKYVWGNELFQCNEPILEKELKLILPATFQLKYRCLNGEVDYQEEIAGNKKITTWRKKMVEQIIDEEMMPPHDAVATRVVYSTAQNWSEVGKWFSKKFYEKVDLNADMRQRLKSLVKPTDSRSDKIRNIVLYVVSKIRSILPGTRYQRVCTA